MKRYRVIISPQAEADFDSLYAFIADDAGKPAAKRFIDRLYAFCSSLKNAPHRGTSREDLMPGLRLLGYRRRATIGFIVTEEQVVILRVTYRGRNVERLFGRVIRD